jgi:hypothetical protein
MDIDQLSQLDLLGPGLPEQEHIGVGFSPQRQELLSISGHFIRISGVAHDSVRTSGRRFITISP